MFKIIEGLRRGTLIFFGTIFVGLALLGIFLPLLPTTPFLLLATMCYAKSSKRFYDWLLNNKYFGNYLKNYQKGKGVPLKVKVYSVTLLWVAIICSVVFVVQNIIVGALLIAIAIGVTIHILIIRTMKPDGSDNRF